MTQVIADLYETDFVHWTDRSAQLLRERRFDELDLENIIEEIEDLGRREKQALYSNLKVLLMHLFKWQFQPSHQSNRWRSTIREHRQRLRRQLQDSPSLKPYLEQNFHDCYVEARDLATDETGLPMASFPVDSPYTIPDTLNGDFLPD